MDRLKKKFSTIYDKNVEKIHRFVFLKVSSQGKAEDITSQVFLKGWQAFQEKGNSIKNPRAFLYQIARNSIVDFYRERDKAQTVSVDDIQLADSSQGIEEKMMLDSDAEIVKKGLRNIKSDYQEVIVLYYLEGLSVKEIASITERSPGAVRVSVHRALKALRKEIREA